MDLPSIKASTTFHISRQANARRGASTGFGHPSPSWVSRRNGFESLRGGIQLGMLQIVIADYQAMIIVALPLIVAVSNPV